MTIFRECTRRGSRYWTYAQRARIWLSERAVAQALAQGQVLQIVRVRT